MKYNELSEEEEYLAKLQKILGGPPYMGVPREPSKVCVRCQVNNVLSKSEKIEH